MRGTLDYSRMRRHDPDIIAIPSTVHIMRQDTLHGMVAMMRPTQYPQGFPGNGQRLPLKRKDKKLFLDFGKKTLRHVPLDITETKEPGGG